jgi:hypothetical protein
MTKRFALPDTLPMPYFTIDSADSEVTVRIGQTEAGDRSMVELWRDGTILCRALARTVRIAGVETPNKPGGFSGQG